jgi:heat induced stress protein YflT
MSPSYAPQVSPRRAPVVSNGPQHLLGEFPTYAGAEQLVDRLSDSGFPVEHTRIVGHDLRTVEYVTGRVTSANAAMAGVASGAWFGLLVGFLLGIFSTNSTWIAVLLGCAGIGAIWGAVFGFLAHRATRGRRDFGSVQGLEAEQYAVYVDADRADEAIRLSGRL